MEQVNETRSGMTTDEIKEVDECFKYLGALCTKERWFSMRIIGLVERMESSVRCLVR